MRAIKNLFVLAIILAAIGGGAVIALRVARQKPSAAENIKPNVVAVSAAGIYLYAARNGSKALLFDTGGDPEGAPVNAALGALGAGRGDVTDVFLTHGHGDHTAGGAGIKGTKVHLGAGDVAMAEGKSPADGLAARLLLKVLAAPPVTVTDPIAGTGVQAIDVGDGKQVKAFPMPGHTPGSYAFLYDGVLFVGDTMVFKQGRLDRAPALFDVDTDGAKRAIAGIKQQLGDTELDAICTGHGGCTPKGLAKNLLDDFVSRL
jgi:glyoxylase-like metal-dependent hydrolase (beta-lactamase superfamily II)